MSGEEGQVQLLLILVGMLSLQVFSLLLSSPVALVLAGTHHACLYPRQAELFLCVPKGSCTLFLSSYIFPCYECLQDTTTLVAITVNLESTLSLWKPFLRRLRVKWHMPLCMSLRTE